MERAAVVKIIFFITKMPCFGRPISSREPLPQ